MVMILNDEKELKKVMLIYKEKFIGKIVLDKSGRTYKIINISEKGIEAEEVCLKNPLRSSTAS